MTIKFITSIPQAKAEGIVAEVYRDMKKTFVFAEPVSLHAPAPNLLKSFWSVFRDVMIGAGESTRWEREVVAGAVSTANACHFCSVTHAAMEKTAPHIGSESERAELADWARSAMNGAAHNAPGASEAKTQELRGVISLFHYLNRMVSTFMNKASAFDPPPGGRELTEAEKKMRQQIMAMMQVQMAKSVAKTGPTDPASVLARIRSSLTEPAAVAGPALRFAEKVAQRPGEVSPEDAAQSITALGGEKQLLEVAARAAISAAETAMSN